ncbi:hypothetical protein EL17_05915 [Anditalea andensis]|uniref:Uncharacterized protein n=2 Tax=Anditalea andensis TaxID=1048983 RepID=A0A074L221_9BACT|nr:hypothetical protein EL17_05915 [Anditalea andensis]
MLTGAFFQRHSLACELLPFMGYEELNRNVFLASDVSSDRIDELTEMIDLAVKRLTETYGVPIATPRIVITSDVAVAAKWGSNETGAMHRMPWCSCIVLGPEGQNVDVIAHEMLHAELQRRVGLLKILNEVPVWFDEGAALTLDNREPFLPENIELSDEKILNVMTFDTHKAFFSGKIRENYQSARMAVIPLIRKESFYEDLDRIKSGKSFHAVFYKNK